jgi:hypothetical protein
MRPGLGRQIPDNPLLMLSADMSLSTQLFRTHFIIKQFGGLSGKQLRPENVWEGEHSPYLLDASLFRPARAGSTIS